MKPYNKTVEEQTEVTFPCKGEAKPANLTTSWYKWVKNKKPASSGYYSIRKQHPQFDRKPLRSINSLGGRFNIKSDGSLVITEVSAKDEGKYECQISNGIGAPITASAYLAVECKFLLRKTIRTYQLPHNIAKYAIYFHPRNSLEMIFLLQF